MIGSERRAESSSSLLDNATLASCSIGDASWGRRVVGRAKALVRSHAHSQVAAVDSLWTDLQVVHDEHDRHAYSQPALYCWI
jgi:hypothetical protein